MSSDPVIVERIAEARALGINIAIDDFGTGYSNLARLKDLPIDRLKIDRSLVKDVAISADARTIIQAIVSLANGLGYECVAEGVESEIQADILGVIGCETLQGYWISKPVAGERFRNLGRSAPGRRRSGGSIAVTSRSADHASTQSRIVNQIMATWRPDATMGAGMTMANNGVAGSSGRILVVDDVEANRSVVCRRLERLNYSVAAAESGEVALKMIEAAAPDLVLLDFMMPNFNGIDVLREIRTNSRCSDVPVIMLTARADAQTVVASLEAGADDYVSKPIDFDVLAARSRRSSSGGSRPRTSSSRTRRSTSA